jgi:hypothetical protein
MSDAQALHGGRTGWPPGMLQDDSHELSTWLSTRPDARRLAREAAALAAQQRRPAA